MAIAVEIVAKKYLDVEAGTPIVVNMPAFLETDVDVYYGNASVKAVLNTDYTVELGGDFSTFTVTPLAALLTKINALIAGDETEYNYITVRRELDYTSDVTPDGVRYTNFTSREFERNLMRLQQLSDRLNRALTLSPNFVGDAPNMELLEKSANATLAFNDDASAIVLGPTAGDVANAQANAAAAVAAKDAAETAGANAAASEAAAAASEAAAGDSEAKAQQWAEEAEDTEVEAGLYSAKHWAAKAAENAAGDAANIAFTPAGNIEATDVQAALEEIDNEKAEIGHSHANTVNPDSVSQAEAEAGTEAADRLWSPLRMAQAIAALTPPAEGVPSGSVMWFAANAAPTGFLKANGAAISRTTYADLFAAIGTTFGVGDGSTTFNLPDLRGEFVRGWDDGRGVDSGRGFGSAQTEAFKSHNHNIPFRYGGTGNSTTTELSGGPASGYSSGTFTAMASAGGTETRPRNIALLACIKY